MNLFARAIGGLLSDGLNKRMGFAVSRRRCCVGLGNSTFKRGLAFVVWVEEIFPLSNLSVPSTPNRAAFGPR